MNTRSPPMRIDTPQVIRVDRDLSHWCCRRQFNRAMSESGVHDKREYPTRWEMTIHYTANDYSLFNTKQSKAYRRKQSSWDCIACHHSIQNEQKISDSPRLGSEFIGCESVFFSRPFPSPPSFSSSSSQSSTVEQYRTVQSRRTAVRWSQLNPAFTKT